MFNIPEDQHLTPSYIKDNTKEYKSAIINKDIILNTLSLYDFILRNPSMVLEVEEQLKTIMRSVWHTRYYEPQTINYGLLEQIIPRNNIGVNIPNITVKFTRNTKVLDNGYFYLQYCLIPSVERSNIDFETYLNIFQNILMAKNIILRYEFKKNFEDYYSDAITEEERKKLADEYNTKVLGLKNNMVFKVINYLNYIYWKNPDKRQLAIKTVLLRYESDSFYDETKLYPTDKFIGYMQKQPRDYHLGILLNIYHYNYLKDISLAEYLTNYVSIMVNVMLGTYEFSFTYTKEQFPILSLFIPKEDILKKFVLKIDDSIKARSYYEFIIDNFPPDLIEKYHVKELYENISKYKNIQLELNKMSFKNYDIIKQKLDKYNIEDIIETYRKYSADNINNPDITSIYLSYIVERDQQNILKDILLNMSFNDIRSYSFYLCFFNDENFFYNCPTVQRTKLIVESAKYLKYCTNITKKFIIEKKSEIDTSKLSGYERYILETIT